MLPPERLGHSDALVVRVIESEHLGGRDLEGGRVNVEHDEGAAMSPSVRFWMTTSLVRRAIKPKRLCFMSAVVWQVLK